MPAALPPALQCRQWALPPRLCWMVLSTRTCSQPAGEGRRCSGVSRLLLIKRRSNGSAPAVSRSTAARRPALRLRLPRQIDTSHPLRPLFPLQGGLTAGVASHPRRRTAPLSWALAAASAPSAPYRRCSWAPPSPPRLPHRPRRRVPAPTRASPQPPPQRLRRRLAPLPRQWRRRAFPL